MQYDKILKNIKDYQIGVMPSMRTWYEPGRIPTIDTLAPGDLEYNINDGALYTRGTQNDIILVNTAGSWMALGGPTAYVSGGVSAWDHGNSSGNIYKRISNGIEITRTGQYRLVYYQRSNTAATSVYGYVTINGSRSEAENNLNGVFYHDHADEISQSVFSSYIGLLNAGDWVSGGANTVGQLSYGTNDWNGNLTIIKL